MISLVFCGFWTLRAQNKLLFSYDTAGNQITRSLCVNCPVGQGRPASGNQESTKEKNIEIEIIVLDKVTFFPNPVQEELNIQWELTDDKTVENIAVYNLNGAIMQNYIDFKNERLKVIPFGSYPSGMYIVSLTYSDGEQKSLQVVKK